MAAQNRLTAEQLAALEPGDPVTIETSGDFRRPRHSDGTVVRLVGSCIVVSCRSPRGVPYVHQFDRRTGVRIGGGHVAQLVTVDAASDTTTEQRRRLARVDACTASGRAIGPMSTGCAACMRPSASAYATAPPA
jgi:hypothetical protein